MKGRRKGGDFSGLSKTWAAPKLAFYQKISVILGANSFEITHRLSTIRGAENILVIRDGAIVEQSGEDNLLNRGGIFYHL